MNVASPATGYQELKTLPVTTPLGVLWDECARLRARVWLDWDRRVFRLFPKPQRLRLVVDGGKRVDHRHDTADHKKTAVSMQAQ